ncbi:MAG: endopygalactorunase [Chitinophagaceae bacterium]|nr:endopygalactorunase [Chitinophagaceae bacterium]
MKKYKLFVLLLFVGLSVSANEYNASFFGIKSDGITNNTGSIQKAIDYISEHRGGTLVFYVGRYLTGTIHLKSGVKIRLEEGAILVGASSPYDYNSKSATKALIEADGQSNIGIYGKGVIEGSGNALIKNTNDLLSLGYIRKDSEPALVSLSNCMNVSFTGIHFWNGPYNALVLNGCKTVNLEGLDINGKNIATSAGIVLNGCKWVNLKDLFVEVKKTPLVNLNNQFVTVQNSITSKGISL